jgi:ATP-dependent protease ClpP protease subunit
MVTKMLDYIDQLRKKQLEAGIVCLYEELCETSVEILLRELHELSCANGEQILFKINSPGGGAYHAFAVHDALRGLSNSGKRIIALVEGYAASAASMIVLQGADHRQARPNARFLIHEIRRWIFMGHERLSELQDQVQEMNELTDRIIRLIVARCGKTDEDVRTFIDRRENWMSAREAMDWGLVDEIVS